jgi:hypothetical protein
MTHDNTIDGRCDEYRIVDEAAFDEFKKNVSSVNLWQWIDD